MSGSSPWNTSGFASPPSTDVTDSRGMPSATAEASRARAKEIMLTLEDGKPGEADKLMGKREAKGNVGLVPLDWLGRKFRRGKKDGGEMKAVDERQGVKEGVEGAETGEGVVGEGKGKKGKGKEGDGVIR